MAPLIDRAAKKTPGGGLLVAVDDAAFRQVVRRHLHIDPVAGQDANRKPPHFTRREAEDCVSIFEFNPKLGVRERLGDGTFLLDGFLFGQTVRSQGCKGVADDLFASTA